MINFPIPGINAVSDVREVDQLRMEGYPPAVRYGRVGGLPGAVSRCVLGTSGIRDERGFRILDAYLAAGGNCLDTAHVYGGGQSERAVGEWIRRTAPDQIHVLVKGAHPPNCHPAAVAAELSQSLDALNIEIADLYMLHRDDPSIPVGEFVDALDAEVAAGRIRAYGASNWTSARVAEASAYAASRGRGGMVAVSNHFSLATPVEPLYPGCEAVSATDRQFLRDSGIALFPWSSQARGYFADVPSAALDPNVWRCWETGENRLRRDRAGELAGILGVRRINIALAFVLCQPFEAFPIIGPQTVDELAVAMDGADVALDPATLRWLEFGGARAGG